MNPSEDVVSYTLRAETAATRLKAANEVVSDQQFVDSDGFERVTRKIQRIYYHYFPARPKQVRFSAV